MKTSFIRLFRVFSAVSVIGLVSCATTPSDRIEAHPQMFSALPNWEKDCVIRGEVRENMTPDAVRLAWGEPSYIAEGQINGVYSQRWIYSIAEPVQRVSFGMGMGMGRYGGVYPGVGTYYYPVDYVPVNVAFVLFQNNKVVSWERRGL